MNDGLLSGSLDIVSGGTTVFVTLWSKAAGTPSAVRGIGAVSCLPLYLLTRDPDVKKIEDLGDKDRIAVTTLKVSVHAILLQMAAEKIWGPGNGGRLDRLVVQIPHGDAAAAMISGAGEINNHFSAPPFQDIEMKKAGSGASRRPKTSSALRRHTWLLIQRSGFGATTQKPIRHLSMLSKKRKS